MIKIFNRTYKFFLALSLSFILGVLFYGYTSNIVLNENIFANGISKSHKTANGIGLGSDGFEEEIPTENVQVLSSLEEIFLSEDKKDNHSIYKFSYKNSFHPEVISPPPNSNI